MDRTVLVSLDRVRMLGAEASGPLGVRLEATTNHDAIRRWAGHHQAEPATGEATASGPATVEVNDGGSGLRFNFPGAAMFRSISWMEWFDHFDSHHLRFVYEESNAEQVAGRAYQLWEARGCDAGHDWEDWFEAERELGHPSSRYRIVSAHSGA